MIKVHDIANDDPLFSGTLYIMIALKTDSSLNGKMKRGKRTCSDKTYTITRVYQN